MKYAVKNINKSYEKTQILKNVSIDFEKGKTTCILGESGVGKTTLLNIISGIIDADSGEVVGFKDEACSFVFQEDRLIEWKNIRNNLSFVLENKIDKLEIEKLIDKYLELVNLQEYKCYYPRKLSGGMRQRISILRAFIYPSNILIMDEPFKSLDINNKQIVMELFKKLKTIEDKTCILITHDIEEALELGDRIIILSNKPSKVKAVIDNTSIMHGNDGRIKLRQLIKDNLKN